MSKFAGIIIGGLEIAGGIAIDVLVPGGAVFGNMLIAAGVGTVIGGVGTLLNQPQQGLTAASRNPVAPWNVVYGRAKVGGTIVYINESGDSDKYLDLVFVLACHPCESVDAVLFDNQRLLFGANGNSIRPTHVTGTDHQETINISTITRSNGVVTVVLSSPFTIGLMDGDQIIIKNVSGQATNDKALNGKWYITVVDSTTITYLCGGLDVSLSGTGQAQTAFPDYREKVHMEVLLGDQNVTFPGMLNGTPYDGDTSLVTVADNPWNANCLLSRRTAVFLRLHYNDEVFSAGLPQISFLVRGKNDIYDPRTGTSAYSENAALCIADYLSNTTFGYKATYGNEIPLSPLMAAANICDEAVTLSSGSSEPRYACNGQFQLSTKRGEVLQNMLTSCGGRLTYSGGQFVINPAAWVGATVQMGTATPTNSAGSPLTSASLVVWASWTPDSTGYGSPNIAVRAGTSTIHSFDLSGLTGSPSSVSYPLSTSDLGLIFQMSVVSSIQGTLGDSDSTAHPAYLNIYDCYFEATFADASTATVRPASTSELSGDGYGIFYNGTQGVVTDAANAIDADANPPVTYAQIMRDYFGSLANAGYLQLSNFAFTFNYGVTPTAITPLSYAAGPFRWKPKVPIRDLYNGVKGTYVSPSNGWQSSDFPPYAQDQLHGYSNGPAQYSYDANLAADGGDRRWLEIQLAFTISPSMAQRLAKIELLRRRQQGSGTFAFNTSLYHLTALDVVEMTLPFLGWTDKLLEVAAHRLTTKQQTAAGVEVPCLGCEIDVQETDPSVYDWSSTEELTPQGFQQSGLPDTGNPQPPTNVTASSGPSTSIIGADGIARSRILVTWTAPADGYVSSGGHIEVQYQLSGATTWTGLPSVDPSVTQIYIDSVTDGQEYLVQIRSVNAAGVPSAWVQAGPVTVSGETSSISTSSISGAGASSGQVLQYDGSNWVATTPTTPLTIGFPILTGTPGTDVGPMIPAPHAGTLSACVVVVKASDPAIALTFTINQNGTPIFSVNPSVAANTASGTLVAVGTFTANPLSVSKNDVFTIDITQGSAAWQFTAQLT